MKRTFTRQYLAAHHPAFLFLCDRAFHMYEDEDVCTTEQEKTALRIFLKQEGLPEKGFDRLHIDDFGAVTIEA